VTATTQTRELLAWIDARPRTYDETIEAWTTSCPRLSVWDDAVSAGLVTVRRGAGSSLVVVTEAGRRLASESPA
jgi:hypothetical protein